MGSGPPKSQLFAGPTRTPIKRATVLDPSEEFQKKLTYYCSSASGKQSQPKKLHLISILSRGGLKQFVSVFEKFASGLRYRSVSAGLSRHNQKNRSIFRGQIWKLGGLPPKNFSAFSRRRI